MAIVSCKIDAKREISSKVEKKMQKEKKKKKKHIIV